MFPNVRMMVVATLASILAVMCGMGMLAAIGINHEAFTRLPGDRPAVQLVFDHTVPAHEASSAPFGIRFQVAQPASDDDAAPPAAVSAPFAAVAPLSPAPTADAPAKETVADTKNAPDVARLPAMNPPASKAADTATLKPEHRRRVVRRAASQLADQNASQQSFQWPQSGTSRPAGAISRAASNKTLEWPPPTIQ